MSNVKERIVGAVTVMNEQDAATLWRIIIDTFSEWNDISAIAPDEVDKQMLNEIETDPECHEFVSEAEAMKELELG